MTNYNSFKRILTSVVLMAFAATGHAQVAPTPEETEYVVNLGRRIEAKSKAEVADLQKQQQHAIAAEQQAERVQTSWAARAATLTGRIECLNWVLREYPRIRGNMDQTAMQQVNALRRELAQLNQELRNTNTQLTQMTTALNNARERRRAAETKTASGEAKNPQQVADLKYFYNLSRLNPPQFTWKTMMDRMTAVALEKQLTSNVTISAGSTPVTVKFQLVSGGQEFSKVNCTRCNIPSLPVGNYNFWIVATGSAAPRKIARLISAESQTVEIGPTTSRR